MKSISITLLLISASYTFTYCQITLFPLNPFPGNERYSAAAFSINGYGYIGSGAHCNTGIYGSADFWKYDPVQDSWSQITSLPLFLQSSCAFAINGKGYLVGGTYMAPNAPNAILYEYDPVLNSWTQKSTYPLTGPYAGTAVVLNGMAYIGTGQVQNLGLTNDFYCYDPAANTWTPKAPIPILSTNCFSFPANNKIYFGGGVVPYNNKVYEYDPALNAWTQKNNLPFVNPVYDFVCSTGFSTSANGYIFGGYGYIYGRGNFIHRYNHLTDTWSLLYSDTTWAPPYFGNSIADASVFVINDMPYISQGVSAANTCFNGVSTINIITNVVEATEKNNSIRFISENSLFVDLNEAGVDTRLFLYTASGQQVYQSYLKKGINLLHIGTLDQGIYFYLINDTSKKIKAGKLPTFY